MAKKYGRQKRKTKMEYTAKNPEYAVKIAMLITFK